MENPDTAVTAYTPEGMTDACLKFLSRLPDSHLFPLWVEGSLDSILWGLIAYLAAENDKLKLAESAVEACRKPLSDCLDFFFERISKSELEARFEVTAPEVLTAKDALETAIEDYNNRCAEFKKLALQINPDYPKTGRVLACPGNLLPDLSRFSE